MEIDNCLTACIVLHYFIQEEIAVMNADLLEIFKLITGLIDSNEA